LDRGAGYVVIEAKPSHSFEIFKDLVTHGAQGLCITRTPPKTIVQQYGLEKTPILWLSRVANAKNCVRPSPPENIAMAVEHFISVSRDSVVLLDGLEYLIAHNDFASVLALLHDMNENVSLQDSILLIPLDPRAIEDREFALIRRDLHPIYPEGQEESVFSAPPIEVHERRRPGP
jgi:two-component system cell cycle response regulator